MQTSIVFVLQAASREKEIVAYRRILGIPLFLRSLFTMVEAGFTHFVLIVPAHARRHILKTWSKYSVGRDVHLELITCRPEHRLTRETLATLRGLVARRFVLLNANTIVTDRWVRDVLRPALVHGRPLVGPGRLLTGRELQSWESNLAADGIPIDHVISTMSQSVAQQYHSVDSVQQIPAAERFLCENLRIATTGVVARHVNKRISLPLSRPLARLRVHPNVITAFNMLVGLAAGIGTGARTYWGLLAGACLFQLASIFDGCDGEVAKLTYRTSKFGQYIDTVSDNFALLSFITGLVIHHYRLYGIHVALFWGIILYSGLGVLFSIMIQFLRRHTDSASLVTFETEYVGRLTQRHRSGIASFARIGKAFMKKDCFSLFALLFALAGILPLWLYIASASVWIGVGTLVLLRAQHRWSPLAQPHVSSVSTAGREKIDVFS